MMKIIGKLKNLITTLPGLNSMANIRMWLATNATNRFKRIN
jgi:hypothetical protein